jgi:hypothetical protein
MRGRLSKSVKASRSRAEKCNKARRLCFEPLEQRVLLDGAWPAAAGSLAITELNYHPYALTAAELTAGLSDREHLEFVELRNVGLQPIDLTGVRFTAGIGFDFTGQAITTLEPGAYALVVSNAEAFAVRYGSGLPIAGTYLGRLDNGGERIRLLDAQGNVIHDFVYDDAGLWPGRADGNGSSLVVADTSGNYNSPLNWHSSAELGGSPGSENFANIVISEIMYHPGFGTPGATGFIAENTQHEYIELFNAGIVSVDLEGWQFDAGVQYVFSPVSLAPGEYLVVAADVAAFQAQYPGVTNVVGGWTGQLSNTGEEIRLRDQFGHRIDSVEYADQGDWALRRPGPFNPSYPGWFLGWDWVTAADGQKRSLELIQPGMSNDYGQNWSASTVDWGTPGAPNSVAALNVAPLILEVTHFPVIPRTTDPVTITARVLDELAGSVTVALHYRFDGQPTFQALAMYDDGLHGDGLAGDRVYGAVLPAWSAIVPAPASKTVEFYVSASDAGGLTRTYPAPTDELGTQGANLLFQYDDNVYLGDQPVYRLVIPQAEWNAWFTQMGQGNPAEDSNARMNATLITVDGTGTRVHYLAGVRNRGEGTRRSVPHNFHIDIASDNVWKEYTSLALNTRMTFAQVAGNAIFAAAGLAAPYGAAVQVRVNSANLAYLVPTSSTQTYQYGSYFWFEPYNARWAEVHYPDDPNGNIYKGVSTVSPPADLRYIDEDPSSYKAYDKQTNSSADDWTDLIELVRVLNLTPDDQYEAEVRRVVDVDQWLTYFAVNSLIGNRENSLGGVGNTGYYTGDDYSLYRGNVDTRFQLLIHDLDTILGQGDYLGPSGQLPYAERLFPTSATRVPAIDRFLKWFAPRYFEILVEQATTTFSATTLNPLLDQVLGSWTPASEIVEMKTYAAQRANYVLTSLIPSRLTATSPLALSNGYPRTTDATTSLGGQADAIRTQQVLVNGIAATYTRWQGAWTISGVPLSPGINRVLVQAMDANGVEIERTSIDIWRERTAAPLYTDVGGTLATGVTTWTLADSPYRVTSSIVVPVDATLIIEPGVTVFFEPAMSMTVQGGSASQNDGRLIAEGTELARIRFTRTPGATSNWNGLNFDSPNPAVASNPKPVLSRADNRVAYADIEYSDGGSRAIKAHNARIYLDHIVFANHTKQYLTIDESAIVLSNSVLPSILSGELVHVLDTNRVMPADGYAIFDGNYFGSTTGYNDIIDFTGGQRPGPIVRFTNNYFAGGSDDGLDLDATDAHIEGNVFVNFHQDGSRESKSHAISTGTEGGYTSRVTIVGNYFYDVDHAILIKDGGFGTIVNNTIVGVYKLIDNATTAAINLYEPRSGQWEGDGVYLDGNVFYNISRLFEHPDALNRPVAVSVNNSIFPLLDGETVAWSGSGNLHVDPRLLNTQNVTDPRVDFQLRPGSPAIGAGPNGRDMGAAVSLGASISGEPIAVTRSTSVTLDVGGPDIYGYMYRLDGGQWSEPRDDVRSVSSITRTGSRATVTLPGHGYSLGDQVLLLGARQVEYLGTFTIVDLTADTFDVVVSGSPASPATGVIVARRSEPIVLTGLSDGEHRVEVITRDSAGVWQDPSQATVSRTWTVDTSLPARLRVNEVLAVNSGALVHEGTTPDAIELYYDAPSSAAPLNLRGMSLSDDPMQPRRFVFADDLWLQPGEHLVVFADGAATSGIHLGFALDGDGDQVLLYDAPAAGGALLDSVSFGLQVPNASIGRAGRDLAWTLTTPTLGQPNVAATLGDTRALKVNEWLASGAVHFSNDFVEIFNADPLPVELSGLYLTNNPMSQRELHAIAPLSFIAGNGFVTFIADESADRGANHVGFKLDSQAGMVALIGADGVTIDQILYMPQTTDMSQGRSPDGGTALYTYPLPHPSVSNPGLTVETTETVTPMFGYTQTWRYNQTENLDGQDWKALEFDDSLWPAGDGLLYVESSALPAPKTTPLTLGRITYYFRTSFEFDGDPFADVRLVFHRIVDDGMVLYLNGVELFRAAMPAGTIAYDTRASSHEAVIEGPTEISLGNLPAGTLRQGENIIAVEVHQTSSTSTDIVWGCTLDVKEIHTTTTIANAIPDNVIALADYLRVTEMMYRPDGDPDLEFIELRNTGPVPLELGGVRFTSGISFTFPDARLGPGEYAVIVRDRAKFYDRYGSGINVVGEYTGNLDDGGESIVLQLPAPYEAAIHHFVYANAWYPSTAGNGRSLIVVDEAAPATAWQQAAGWQAGSLGGTPGRAETDAIAPSVIINEVLTHTDPPQADSIELHNPTDAPISIAGWYLSDSSSNYRKYRIDPLDPRAVIPAHGFVYFTEADFNPTPAAPGPNDFGLNGAHGDNVWLVAADADGVLRRFVDFVEFGAAANGESLGRWPDAAGRLYPMQSPTLGAANSGPRVGPLLISELNYAPLAGGDEFIEIVNTSSDVVDLTNWRIGGGVTFAFPAGATLAPNQVLIVSPLDAAAFRAKYAIPVSVLVFGGFSGALDNSGERVQLFRPDVPPANEPNFYPLLLEDEIDYLPGDPWPAIPAGQAASLQRGGSDLWGNAPTSWFVAAPTPGIALPAAPDPASVVGRHVFYNDSSFDGNGIAVSAADDDAVAPDKSALLPGAAATFANYTSYSRGINGLMIDIADLRSTTLEPSDFQFLVGNSADPANWTAAPQPLNITVRPGAGANGSDRVTIVWADGAVANTWLQVTVNANVHTGLAADDVFYFGNAIGETGDSPLNTMVDAHDEQAILARSASGGAAALVDRFDLNRDGVVDDADEAVAEANQTGATPLALLGRSFVLNVAAGDWTDAGLTLRLADDGLLHLYLTGTTTDAVAAVVATSISGIQIVGRDNAADMLTLDFGGGSPIPNSGLSFDGGMGSGANMLAIAAATRQDTLTMTASRLIVNGSSFVNQVNVLDFGFDLGDGLLDLGGETHSVGGVTLISGQIANGTLNGSSYTIFGGTVTATLGPGPIIKQTAETATVATPINATTVDVQGGHLTVPSIVTATLVIGAGATLELASSGSAGSTSVVAFLGASSPTGELDGSVVDTAPPAVAESEPVSPAVIAPDPELAPAESALVSPAVIAPNQEPAASAVVAAAASPLAPPESPSVNRLEGVDLSWVRADSDDDASRRTELPRAADDGRMAFWAAALVDDALRAELGAWRLANYDESISDVAPARKAIFDWSLARPNRSRLAAER